MCCPAHSAEGDEPVDWLTTDPFDTITLNSDNGALVLKVQPLELPERTPSQVSKRAGTIRLRMFDDPDSLYELDWNAVVRVELFEYRLLDEAIRLTQQQDFYRAFQIFSLLFDRYPRTEGLDDAYHRYLTVDAMASFRAGRFDDALLALEETSRRRPGVDEVNTAVRRIVEGLLSEDFQAGRFDELHSALDHYSHRFGDAVAPTVEQWRSRLQQKALENVQRAGQLRGVEQAAERRLLCHEALQAWPEVPGAAELLLELYMENAVVRVGVHSLADHPNPQLLVQSSARRLASLVNRPLVEIERFADDGAVITSRLGTVQPVDDAQWILSLDRSISPSAYDVYQSLRETMAPSSPAFQPWLATSVRRIAPVGDAQLEVHWSRPGWNPVSLFNTAGHWPENPPMVLAPYGPASQEGSLRVFQRDEQLQSGPGQIVEQLLAPGDDWQKLWELGQLDVIERILPSQRADVGQWKDAVVVRYRFPSQHWLVFNRRLDRWRSRDMRRAMLYGIDRQRLLDELIVGGEAEPGCMVTSGPCGAGLNRDDPLGFGYAWELDPRPYDPLLAKMLLRLDRTSENKLGSPVPENADSSAGEATEPGTQARDAGEVTKTTVASTGAEAVAANVDEGLSVVLAHPPDAASTEICQRIAKGWSALGVQCQLRPLDAGQTVPDDDSWDLVFVDVRIREPVSDMHRLFGPNGQLPFAGPYVRAAQHELARANEFAEVRQALRRLHQATYDDVALVPLWQMVDFAVHRRGLTDIGAPLVELYDHVERWSWKFADQQEASP